MDATAALASLLAGLGLFFVGVRALSANLVLLAGRRTRTMFAGAMRGPVSTAVSGVTAGLLTQSSIAVSWIILGLVRAGVLTDGPALMAPTWSGVGAAMLPLVVAVNTATTAGFMIGLVGFSIYFRLDRVERVRHILEAALGAALLLFGLQLVAGIGGAMHQALILRPGLAIDLQNPMILAVIGIVLALVAQSSSVAAALAVTAVGAGLISLPGALPLIAGANAASAANNLSRLPRESLTGRLVFALQAAQKIAGAVLLLAVMLAAAGNPVAAMRASTWLGQSPRTEVAVLFAMAQIAGALATSLITRPIGHLVRRFTPAHAVEGLAEPAFLLFSALADPPVALDLALRELARLCQRLPLMLEQVRAEHDSGAPVIPAKTLCAAGVELAGTLNTYLTSLLDQNAGRREVATTIVLQAATANTRALHETLADLVAAAQIAAPLAATARLVESLHVSMWVVADHAETLGGEDPQFALKLLGDRDRLMEDLRQRLTSAQGATPAMQDALFQITVLFERIVWLGRRLVLDISQTQRGLAAD